MNKNLLEIAKPILFNTEMVQAILDGRKTVTRRIVGEDNRGTWDAVNNCRNHEYGATVPCYLDREISVDDYSPNIIYPKHDVGDYLYVRETFKLEGMTTSYDNDGTIIHQEIYYAYKADGFGHQGKWTPSIHMPKSAARILLKVTDVRVKRLQDINGDGLEKEGIKTGITHFKSMFNNFGNAERFEVAQGKFSLIWDSTVKKQDLDKYGWSANPFVWVYEFERVNDDE